MEKTSRRRALRDGMLLVAGTVGAGAIGERVSASAAPPAPGQTFTVFSSALTSFAAGRQPGQTVQRGDRLTSEAQLLDGPAGNSVGTFYAAGFALRHAAGAGDAATLELHTFELAEGTLIGTGTAGSARGGVFAVVGGTGRYLGASGSYVVEQDPRDPGSGATRFSFTLVR